MRQLFAVLFVLLVALFAFIQASLLTSGLFVFTEARSYIHYPEPTDISQFLLFPELQWGSGRLMGLVVFQTTGALCQVDIPCTHLIGASLFSVVAVLLVLHTWQLSGSWRIAAAAALLWLISGVALGIGLWQATWFDLVGLIFTISAGAVWWHYFGLPTLSIALRCAIAVLSVGLMALAFNAKETTYVLLGIIVLIAVVRGAEVEGGGVRRNLIVALGPVVWGTFFTWHALTHIAPEYAQHASVRAIVSGVSILVGQSLGVAQYYMYVWQVDDAIRVLQALAAICYAAAAAGTIILCALWVRPRLRRLSAWRMSRSDLFGLLQRLGPGLYVGVLGGATLLINARSQAASAYYMAIPYWALLVVVLLVLRGVADRVVLRRLALVVVGIFTCGTVVGYAGLLADGSTWSQLQTASRKMSILGDSMRVMLQGRAIEMVAWRTQGHPDTFFYTLRTSSGDVGPELWPWLVGDPTANPTVTPIDAGTTDELRQNLRAYSGPGSVLVVISEDYELELLAYQGQVLYHDQSEAR